MADIYRDNLNPEIVAADKAAWHTIYDELQKAEEAVHTAAMAAFAIDPDVGLNYLATYDEMRRTRLSMARATAAPWQGGPSTGPDARDVWIRRPTPSRG